jgi:hypothetical protein
MQAQAQIIPTISFSFLIDRLKFQEIIDNNGIKVKVGPSICLERPTEILLK